MKQRIMTGILAATGFLTLLWLGGFWFVGLILLISLIASYEFISIQQMTSKRFIVMIGFIGTIFFVFPWGKMDFMTMLSFEAKVWLWMFILFAITVFSKNKLNIEKISLLFIGIIYIGVGFHYMIETRLMDNGLFWTLLIFICIWLTDTAAYFTGMLFGKHKLWPSISPKKTIEGAIGGIIASIIAAILFSYYAPQLLPIDLAIWIGLLVSVVGQLGDFIQSAYKRVWNVKDSGAILPGHGGILDRCDSWLIVFPFVHILLLIP